MGAVNQLLSKHNVDMDIHRDQAIVERFNRILAERLFGHQYGVEMRLPDDKRSNEWVARFPAVISALNKEVTRLTGKKPAEAIKKKTVSAKPSTPYFRPVGVNEKSSPPGPLCQDHGQTMVNHVFTMVDHGQQPWSTMICQ